MNVFRLVLCLAGLAAYLVAKQWIHSSPAPASPVESRPSGAPLLPVSHQVRTESCPGATTHAEVAKTGHSAEVRK
jgi:hypothetical protein